MDSLRKSLICFIAGICFVGSVFCAETPAVAEVRQADDLPATEAEVSPPVDIWIAFDAATPCLSSTTPE